MKSVVADTNPAPFTILRFAIAAAIASPYTPSIPFQRKVEKSQRDFPQVWRWGAEMGAWMFLGFSFQALGLESTTAQRSGFLLYLNVKFVPFFSKVLLGRPISVPTWASAFSAFLGTALLTIDAEAVELNNGDAWSVAAAAASAMNYE